MLQNPAAALHFNTLSGTLTVTRQQLGSKQLLQMSLPVSAAVDPLPPSLLPQGSGSSSEDLSKVLQDSPALVQLLTACLQRLPTAPTAATETAQATQQLLGVVEHVGYCSAVKYLLVVLKAGTSRAGIEKLQPDYASLAGAVSGDHMIGVIVTAAAAEGEMSRLRSFCFSRAGATMHWPCCFIQQREQ